jgi:hypothetical protein
VDDGSPRSHRSRAVLRAVRPPKNGGSAFTPLGASMILEALAILRGPPRPRAQRWSIRDARVRETKQFAVHVRRRSAQRRCALLGLCGGTSGQRSRCA